MLPIRHDIKRSYERSWGSQDANIQWRKGGTVLRESVGHGIWLHFIFSEEFHGLLHCTPCTSRGKHVKISWKRENSVRCWTIHWANSWWHRAFCFSQSYQKRIQQLRPCCVLKHTFACRSILSLSKSTTETPHRATSMSLVHAAWSLPYQMQTANQNVLSHWWPWAEWPRMNHSHPSEFSSRCSDCFPALRREQERLAVLELTLVLNS